MLKAHIVPHRDEQPHELTDDCWCNPDTVEGITVHAPADLRDVYENLTGEGRPDKLWLVQFEKETHEPERHHR